MTLLEVKTAGVVIDNWKLKTFKKVLTERGFHYKLAGKYEKDLLIINVDYLPERFDELNEAIDESNSIADKSKRH